MVVRHRKPFTIFVKWCTLSNLPFLVIGLLRLYTLGWDQVFYWILVASGLCSAYHHASPHSWTIVIDWLPISCGILLGLYEGIIWSASWVTLFKLLSAFGCLFADHFWTPIPVPWGHSMWHLLAAYGMDDLFRDHVSTFSGL